MRLITQDQTSQDVSRSVNIVKTSQRLMMVMTPAAQIAVPPKGQITLAPNGVHLMVFGIKTKPVSGDKISLSLKLDDRTLVPVTATVRD